MAQPRKVVLIPPAEAVFILEALVREGRIDSRTVDEFRTRFREEIASLEARLAYLRELSGALVPVVAGAAAAVASPVARKVERAAPKATRAATKAVKIASKESPGRTRTRELQGRYLGLMHKIPKAVMKQRFGKEAIAKKGKEAVLQEMEIYLAERR